MRKNVHTISIITVLGFAVILLAVMLYRSTTVEAKVAPAPLPVVTTTELVQPICPQPVEPKEDTAKIEHQKKVEAVKVAILDFTKGAPKNPARLNPEAVSEWVVSASEKESVELPLLYAVIRKESAFNPRIGPKGEIGPAQLLPKGPAIKGALKELREKTGKKLAAMDLADGPLGYWAAAIALRQAYERCPSRYVAFHHTGKCETCWYERDAYKIAKRFRIDTHLEN